MAGFKYTNAAAGLDEAVAAVLARGAAEEDEFDRLMRRGFALQFEASARYRSGCLALEATPKSVAGWRDIPAVTSFPHAQRLELLFGRDRGEALRRKSRAVDLDHTRGPFFPDQALLELMAAAQVPAARRHLFPDVDRMKLLFFAPHPRMAPGMVMAAGFERFRRAFGTEGSRFLISFRGFDLRGFVTDLRQAEATGEPVAILGVTHGLDYFLDACLAGGVRFRLPRGSRLMDSGGFMGRYTGCTPPAFYEKCRQVFGLERPFCLNAFWICESGTVYFDEGFGSDVSEEERIKIPPRWARVEVIDPVTFDPAGEGKPGLLRLHDLTNRGMAVAVLSDKMGYRTADGFQIVGKLHRTDPAGGIDPHPPHPGGKTVSRVMEFMMRKRMSGVAKADGKVSVRR